MIDDMAERQRLGSYDQLCPVATGTDAIGDRWTLLLLRDLAQTPLRFSELEATNPGISPSVLTKRLARLESDGVIETVEHGRQKRFQLMPAIRSELLTVLDAVSQLGLALSPDEPVTAEDLVRQLATDRAWFLAKHHRTVGVFHLHIDDVDVGLTVDQYTFDPVAGVPEEPTATVTCPIEIMLAINTTELSVAEAIGDGSMTVEGDVAAVEALFDSLSAPYIGAA